MSVEKPLIAPRYVSEPGRGPPENDRRPRVLQEGRKGTGRRLDDVGGKDEAHVVRPGARLHLPERRCVLWWPANALCCWIPQFHYFSKSVGVASQGTNESVDCKEHHNTKNANLVLRRVNLLCQDCGYPSANMTIRSCAETNYTMQASNGLQTCLLCAFSVR